MNRKIIIVLIIASAIAIIWLINYGKKDNNASQGAVRVDVAKVIRKNMPYVLHLSGITEVYHSVEVRSLVNGQIMKIDIQEGQKVKADELLFEIDSRAFQYQLQQAQAALLRDQMQLENAEKEEIRYRKLLDQNATSEEQYLQILTNLKVLKATIDSDNSIISTAALQIEYSKIKAPIDGIAGEIQLGEGNLVEANNQTLVTINTISPIYVSFSVPAQHLPSIRKAKEAGNLPVSILPESGQEITNGEITFIDNTIDSNSSTIKIKALLQNTDEVLWPGEFVKVSLNIFSKENAVVVPVKALQINQNGTFVFVVDQDNKVNIRNIKVDFSDDTEAVVAEGLEAGETVVINGQLYLSQGKTVILNDTNSQ